jgi:hypothetical protein
MQNVSDESVQDLTAACHLEFDGVVQKLHQNGIKVVEKHNPDTEAPDAIFPNNWFSVHREADFGASTLILYPLRWPERQRERRPEFVETLQRMYTNVIDLTHYESEGIALESTGSLVFDKLGRKIYMSRSERSSEVVLQDLVEQINSTVPADQTKWEAIVFDAKDANGKTIYHTNVVMGLTPGHAVVCLDSIANEEQKAAVTNGLRNSGYQIIPLTFEAMGAFAGNILTVHNPETDTYYVVISETSKPYLNETHFDCQGPEKVELLYFSIPTIEKVGGGSIRCMLAELF